MVSPLRDKEVSELASLVKNFIESPIWSGLILDITRSAPLSAAEVFQHKQDMWMKEVNTMNQQRRPSSLNYDAIFRPEFHHESFVPNFKPRPDVNEFIHDLLVKWRKQMQEIPVIYPRMSTKSAARSSQRWMEEHWNWRSVFDEEDDEFTQCVMERFYCDTGQECQGGCEMRQKWYRSGVSPRTYYAQGGDAFHSSKYLQDGFNLLVDLLPTSNHVLRLIPSNLELDTEDSYVFIYDLSSFTSNFHEHYEFVRRLAEFCRGYPVTIWDGRVGERCVDLGELLSDYAVQNLQTPRYSWERWKKGDYEDHHHDVAGFLGVFGNLMGCTFLHSATILTIVGSVRKLYTAGDDGGAAVNAQLMLRWSGKNTLHVENPFYDDVNLVFFALLLLGKIQWAKVFATCQEGAIALKRPLVQLGKTLSVPLMLIWPSLSLIDMYLNWPPTDLRFSDYKLTHTRSDCLSAICVEINRFLRSLVAYTSRISDEDLVWIHHWLLQLYKDLSLPVEGFVPQYETQMRPYGFVADIADFNTIQEDHLRRTLLKHWKGWCRVPTREYDALWDLDVDQDIFVGNVFVGKKNAFIRYLESTRYVECEGISHVVYGADSLKRIISEYEDEEFSPKLYRVKINSLPLCCSY